MSESDIRRDSDEPDDFIEAQDGDYEPEARVYDEDDLPVDEDDDAEDEVVPDDERHVPLDPYDAGIA